MAKRKARDQPVSTRGGKPTPVCHEVRLPEEERPFAALRAVQICPVNAAANTLVPDYISVQKYWGSRAADLTIGFMQQTDATMRNKVLAYANRWGEFSYARFRWTQTSPTIRISFGRGGYYSYLGTDNLSIPKNQHTMNLEGFTVNTPDSEWERVVIHEFGHALGCPHEQQRRGILDLLDVQKTIAYFMRTQGWSEQQVRQQILVPLEESSLMGASPQADQQSIMCYEFPGSVTKSGQPIVGGHTISPTDREYFARVYPPINTPAPPLPPTPPPTFPVEDIAELVARDVLGTELAVFKRVP